MLGTIVLAWILTVTPEMPLSIAHTDDGLAIFANPAGLGTERGFEFYYLYDFQPQAFLSNNSFALRIGTLGVFLEPEPLRYGLALGAKQDNLLAGVRLVRDSLTHWDIGAMVRFGKWVSLGGVWQDLNHKGGRLGAGAAVRPFGSRFTIFSESYFNPFQPFAGFEVEPVSGLKFKIRAKLGTGEDFGFLAGLTLSLGRFGVGVLGSPKPQRVAGEVRISQDLYRSILPPRKRFLEWRLSEHVADQKPGFSLMGAGKVRTTYALLDLVKRAKDDRVLTGMVLRLEGENLSFAQAQELRQALADFRAAGKKVWVYAPSLGMIGYYLASAADKVIVHPMGDVVIPGVSVQAQFIKGALDKLGIKTETYRFGKYKSAVEMFTEETLSVYNREQLQALVDGIYEDFIQTVSAGRSLDTKTMESLVGRALFRADEAKALGLVDTLCYEDELDSLIRLAFKGRQKIDEKFLQRAEIVQDQWGEPAQIAVIYITGSIVRGESRTNFLTGEQEVGSTTVCRAIKQAGKDKKVKGVVLRVDSPGGDGFASDLIWRELELVKKKKPVVVSMGTLAASGGYYVSCNADKIFALPGTITGSIGVFNLRLITEGFYNKLGIRRQTVKRGEHADLLSDIREATPEEDSIIQSQIDWFYNQFITKVAKGRGLTLEGVDSVAQGRVWLAKDARRFGLVDSLGGLIEAIEFCREKAKLGRDYRLEFYPKRRFGLGSLLEQRFEQLLFDVMGR
ncbi:MAG: signal peptide peptidase SppA [candidate division WOR-3 bacterium]|jgi:protease-4|nr:signal peptide peptidase SppA [candidate division WOR-3 bacterium]MDH7518470.1 signal peptide peptidase SppA [bacterium]